MAVLDGLARSRLHILTLADALDLDTLRLLGMLGPESTAAGALAHVDLLSAILEPAANTSSTSRSSSSRACSRRIALRRPARTRCTATRGSDKGSLDSLVLTELAWDEASSRAG